MNRDDIDRWHRHHCSCRAPHRRCRGARCCHDDRAEEDPVCQAEEGVVQAALGVGTITLLYSSSSVASVAANAAADAVP